MKGDCENCDIKKEWAVLKKLKDTCIKETVFALNLIENIMKWPEMAFKRPKNKDKEEGE